MDIGLSSWRACAAYLYVLKLDAVSLAWEYLRRNLTYQAQWMKAADGSDGTAAIRWGLQHLEDPRRDGRVAEPIWQPTPSSSVWLTRLGEGDASTEFQFWQIPGEKSLIHDGVRLQLTARRQSAIRRAMLASDLGADQPYAFCLPVTDDIAARCRAVNEFATIYHPQVTQKPAPPPARPTRSSLTHMRMLQAVDGSHAGASQRDIAIAIFGDVTVKDQWTSDSELRARTRYWLRRGTALADGGYRTLLSTDSS